MRGQSMVRKEAHPEPGLPPPPVAGRPANPASTLRIGQEAKSSRLAAVMQTSARGGRERRGTGRAADRGGRAVSSGRVSQNASRWAKVASSSRTLDDARPISAGGGANRRVVTSRPPSPHSGSGHHESSTTARVVPGSSPDASFATLWPVDGPPPRTSFPAPETQPPAAGILGEHTVVLRQTGSGTRRCDRPRCRRAGTLRQPRLLRPPPHSPAPDG